MNSKQIMAQVVNSVEECDGAEYASVCEQSIAMFLSALKEAGFVVVPVEPTDDMVDAGDQIERDQWRKWGCIDMKEVYRAMIAAQEEDDENAG